MREGDLNPIDAIDSGFRCNENHLPSIRFSDEVHLNNGLGFDGGELTEEAQVLREQEMLLLKRERLRTADLVAQPASKVARSKV